MLLAVASSKRDSGGEETSQTRAAISTFSLAHVHRAGCRRKSPKARETKASLSLSLSATPALHVTCTRVHTSLLCTNRGERRNTDFSRSDSLLCALRRREHVHGPRVRFDEPRASMRERERERRERSLSGVQERVVYSTVIVWLRFFGG